MVLLFDGLTKAIADLNNTRAGWVTRRDSAEALGKFARHALSALNSNSKDDDQDVRAAVVEQLRLVGTTPALIDE